MQYEGLHILLWRVLARCLAPLATLQLWTFYHRDLTTPIGEFRARGDVTITLATDSDIEQLATLVARRYGPARAGPHERRRITATIDQRLRRGLKCFVATTGTEIVHYNWLAFQQEKSLGDAGSRIALGEGEAFCSDAYTAESWRGKGIHTAVVHHMLVFLQQAGYRKVYTDVASHNKSSWKTHERLGWEVCGTALDFKLRGAHTTWRWRLRGTLGPFVPKPGTFMALPPCEDGGVQPPR
jgi:ribosomal protein S18 acetylase RimI-like enzyme